MNAQITTSKLKDLLTELERIEFSTLFRDETVQSARLARIQLEDLIKQMFYEKNS